MVAPMNMNRSIPVLSSSFFILICLLPEFKCPGPVDYFFFCEFADEEEDDDEEKSRKKKEKKRKRNRLYDPSIYQ